MDRNPLIRAVVSSSIISSRASWGVGVNDTRGSAGRDKVVAREVLGTGVDGCGFGRGSSAWGDVEARGNEARDVLGRGVDARDANGCVETGGC